MDDETGTYWDHISGEALHGPLKGSQMEAWPLTYTTLTEALKQWPEIDVIRERSLNPVALFFQLVHRKKIGRRGFIPFIFRRTMQSVDDRFPEMTQGLGVIVDGRTKFYPTAALAEPVDDDFNGAVLRVAIGPDRVPHAEWPDGTRPMQLFTRWYGFVATYPDCEVLKRA